MRWKTCLLVTPEIVRLFVKTLIAGDKYSRYKIEKFGQTNEMQLSKNRKTCYQLVVVFLISASNFQHFEKKDEDHGSTISDIINSEINCYLNLLKAMF